MNTMNTLTKTINVLNLPRRLKEESIQFFDKIDSNSLINKSIFFCGKSGTGKTIHALHALITTAKIESKDCEDIFYENFQYEFVIVPELLLNIKKTFNSKSNEEGEMIQHYQNIDYLILDDFGIEKSTEWVLQILYLIINYRYNEYKTTVVTSNYTPDELIKKLGDDRIVSRLLDMCEIVIKKKKYR